MSNRIAAVALVTCVLVAGCGGPFAGEGTTEGETTDSTTDSERVIAAPPSNGTTAASRANGAATTGTATAGAPTGTDGGAVGSEATGGEATGDETTLEANGTATTQENVATYDSDIGYELRVSNAGETAHRVTVRVAAVNDSAVAFDDSVRLAPNESREFEFTFPHAGAYEASVEVGDANVARRWAVASRNPDGALSVHVGPDGEVYVGFVEI